MFIDLSLNDKELQQFQELGFVGPFNFLEPQDVDSLTASKSFIKRSLWEKIVLKIARITEIQDRKLPSFFWGKARWNKGLHVALPEFYKLSTNPVILDKVSSILGDNILQWSAHILNKKPSNDYCWHRDVELLEIKGVTVWLALTNVTKQSSIAIITGSHEFLSYPQELRSNSGLNITDDYAVLEEAQKLNSKCELISVDIKPGEFFIFAGSLWHSAKNSSSVERTAIIFQYSPPSEKIQIPITNDPPILWKSSSPPCLLLKGKNEYDHNLIVLPPK
ncbi:MAG: phytanoyl-CoA dioxygenase family protein [Xenococcus sp. MO_188.B8]|nr:phytanoyl-CoA dioxygenase family protein [Xenococcus sp. MO_188.B8]